MRRTFVPHGAGSRADAALSSIRGVAELDNYTRCVDENPRTWQRECASGKAALTACAASHSGLVNSLKERCRAEIEQYERCLKANAAKPDTCLPQLHRMWDCSEGDQATRHVCGPDCKQHAGRP